MNPGLGPTQVERFEVVEIHRSQIKNAPYNPRTISAGAKKKLKRGITKLGMLGPACNWNEPTGNAFGGNQRLGILDALHGSQDYMLRVAKAVPPLTEVEEREACLLLNNAAAQGEWDAGLLESLLRTPSLDLDVTGFEAVDMYRMFGEGMANESHADQIEELAEKLKDNRDRLKKAISGLKAKDNDDYYLVFVFRSYEHRLELLELLGLPDNRYQDGRAMLDVLQEKREGS